MGGPVFTVVAENVSLTLVYWKQTVLIMQAMEVGGYYCHSESLSIHGLHDSEHYPVERRD
jgi:phospholipase C